jgi:formylglycine-generating enzyme
VRARHIAFVVPTAVIVACNGILGIEDRELRRNPNDLDAKTDTTTAGDGPITTDAADAADAAPELDAGPGLVAIVPPPGGYAIDRREVTVAEYATFLAAGAFDAGSPSCAWKTSYALPVGCTANSLGAQPVVCVDWCAAFAYCAWAGKRLCGRLGGGAAQLVSDFPDASSDEWTFACAGGADSNRWCYGPTADTTKCNTIELEAGAMTAAGSLPACVGSARGLFDMSGNAWEWENACLTDSGTAPKDEGCAFRGGASRNPLGDAKCSVGTFLPRSGASQDVGFRCCKSL